MYCKTSPKLLVVLTWNPVSSQVKLASQENNDLTLNATITSDIYHAELIAGLIEDLNEVQQSITATINNDNTSDHSC